MKRPKDKRDEELLRFVFVVILILVAMAMINALLERI